jgi:hypothetical protein
MCLILSCLDGPSTLCCVVQQGIQGVTAQVPDAGDWFGAFNPFGILQAGGADPNVAGANLPRCM